MIDDDIARAAALLNVPDRVIRRAVERHRTARPVGRPPTVDVSRAAALLDEGLTVTEIARRLGCHEATLRYHLGLVRRAR